MVLESEMDGTKQRELEELIGYTFDRKELLIRAASHSSRNTSHSVISNDELAFLGDSVLYHVTTKWIFQQFPEETTERLHERRETLKRNRDLASIGRKMGMEKFIIVGNSRWNHEPSDRMVATMVEAIIGAISIEDEKAANEFIQRIILSIQ